MNKLFTAVFCLLVFSAYSQFEQLESGTTSELRDVHFINRDTGFVIGRNGTLLRTEDGGDHWQPIDLGVTDLLQHIDFPDESVGYITGVKGILMKTTDGGLNWTSVAPDGYSKQFFNLSFTSRDTGYVTYENGVLMSTSDGGMSWTAIQTPLQVFGPIYFHTAGHGIAAGYKSNGKKSILTTEDTCMTWESFDTTLHQYYLSMDFPTSDTGFICTTGGTGVDGFIYRSIDGGKSWHFVYREFTEGGLITVHFPSANIGYVVGGPYENASLLRTTDGGNSWTSYGFASGLNGCYFIDENNGYIVGTGGTIFRVSFDPVDVIDMDRKDELLIFPNPVKDYIFYQYTDNEDSSLQATVFSMTGELVLQDQLTAGEKLDCRIIPEGAYVLQLDANKKTVSKLFIKL